MTKDELIETIMGELETHEDKGIIPVNGEIKKIVIELLITKTIKKAEGKSILKSDYMVCSYVGLLQAAGMLPEKNFYYIPAIRELFKEIKKSKSVI